MGPVLSAVVVLAVLLQASASAQEQGRTAIALKFLIEGERAKVTVALNYLTKAEDRPGFVGVRFYTYDVELSGEPKSIGWAPGQNPSQAELKTVLLRQRRYTYYPMDVDRFENGSIRIAAEPGARGRYRVEGVYCYFGEVFIIDAVLAPDEPLLLFEEPLRGAAGVEPIHSRDLQQRPVIGDLGVPLGTVTDVRATVVAGRELGSKAWEGRYLLRVTHVGGRQLPEARVMEFSAAGSAKFRLAAETFDLYTMKTGQKTAGLDDEQIAKLEEGYVGRAVHLSAYETGGYQGIVDLPTDPPAAGVPFSFRTWLVIVAERE